MNKRKSEENVNIQTTKQAEILQDKILSDDGMVKFDFMTSLQKMASAVVISNLWMSENTQQEIIKLFHSDDFSCESNKLLMDCLEPKYKEKLRQVKNYVLDKVSELCLPNYITSTLKKIVPDFGDFIFDWIREYHDTYTLNTAEKPKYCAVDLISHIVWTSRGRIDLTKTAKNILANQERGLSDDHKYKLACIYCLEDEIAVLVPKVVNQYYLDGIDISTHPMVYFWTGYVTGDYSKLHHHYRLFIQDDSNVTINMYITQLLISDKMTINTVPILYMWNKLNDQEKTEILPLLFKNLDNLDMKCSLLSNLDYKQQQVFFKDSFLGVLHEISNDWLWNAYFFPIVHHILGIIDPPRYHFLFFLIIYNMKQVRDGSNYICLHQYKSFLKNFWHDNKRHILEHMVAGDFEYFKFYKLSWKQDLDIIDLVFESIKNAEVKKKLIFSKSGIERCSELMKNDEWDSLELFMKRTLSSERDISEFKKTLIRVNGDEIALEYLRDEEYDKIEHFMIWAFESEDEIYNFQQSLACTIASGKIIISLDKNDTIDFTKLENYLKWCSKGDAQLINKLKAAIRESCSRYFIELRKRGKNELFLNWLSV